MSSVKSAEDLLEVISWAATECVNESSQHRLENALKQGYREDAKLYLESDADEQLIIHINFNSPVKLQTLTIGGPDDGHGPKHVKLFMNRPTIGFSEAEEEAATQALELTPANLKGESIQLRLAKFQGVNSLSLFVGSNQGDEEVTRITKIVVAGATVQGMNVGDIKKEEGA